MLTALTNVATTHSSGTHILCVIVLIGAIVGTIICILSAFGGGIGPLRRSGEGYGYLGAPVLVTVILWVIYFVVCPG